MAADHGVHIYSEYGNYGSCVGDIDISPDLVPVDDLEMIAELLAGEDEYAQTAHLEPGTGWVVSEMLT